MVDRSAPRRRNPNRLSIEWLEDRVVPSRPLPFPVIFAGSGAGSPAVVGAFDAETGKLTFKLTFERPAFEPAFTGGVNVATADFTRDGYPDVVLASGTGGGPRVRVLDGKTGEQITGPVGNFLAYDPAFAGGVAVAAADVTGDGTPDVLTAAGAGGGPHVRAFDSRTGASLQSFFALGHSFRGGLSIAAADYTGDGKAEVVVGAGAGGGPRVRVLDLTTGRPVRGPLGDFFAADPGRRSGVAVGADALAGDVNADGTPDLATGSGAGEASRVVVYSGKDGSVLSEFSPFGREMTAGVRVATAYVTADAAADVVVSTGPGVEGRVRVFDGATGQLISGPVADFPPFGAGYSGGVSIAASNDPLTPPYSAGPVTWEVRSIDPNDPTVYHVTVAVEVVIDPIDPSRDLWTYQLKNLDFSDGINVFQLGHYGADVDDDTATHGFFHFGNLYWESGYLPVGETATFTFTTDPRPIVDIWGQAFDQVGLYYGPDSNKVKGPGVAGDLDIIDSNGAVVAEDKEENPGGWVSINNDNDNYTFDPANPLSPKADLSETNKVVEENDLIKIEVKNLAAPAGVQGAFKLEWSSAKIKVWKSPDKDTAAGKGEVSSGVEVAAGQVTPFWVEGLSLSAAAMAEQIRLTWTPAGGAAQDVDAVNFTVYEVTGVGRATAL